MSWGTRRRNGILFIIFLLITIPIGIVLFNTFYNPPNCFDGTRNGTELGVDCGGVCELLCQSQYIEPITQWQRFFEVQPGLYNAVAYIENPNPDAQVKYAPYLFKLYDKNGVLIAEKTGSTHFFAKQIKPIIASGFFTDQLEAERMTFEFTESLVFEKALPQELVLVIKDEELIDENTEPRITAEVVNTSLLPVTDIQVVVLVYDDKDNVIGSSSTVIKRIEKNQASPIIYTWPEPFAQSVSRIEIIPLYDSP